MTSEDLALTSDGVKYASVTVDEDADGDYVVPQEADERIRLSDDYVC